MWIKKLAQNKIVNRLLIIGDALSQLANTLIGGMANESLSGRAHRTGSRWEKIIDALFWFDKEHCRVAHENDVKYCDWLKQITNNK